MEESIAPPAIFLKALPEWLPHQKTFPGNGAQNIQLFCSEYPEGVSCRPCTLQPASPDYD